jgi:hypothetical protein
MRSDIEQRILACENENARLRKLILRQNFLWIIVLLLAAGVGAAAASVERATFGTITANEVAVVDAKGIVRARLGGDLPDAVMADGRVAKRGSKAAGLIIYDEQGIERGGYVTQDTGSNAMLTLDSKHKQAVLLVAAPDKEQASALRLWTQESAIELRSDSNGSRISANDKRVVTFQAPLIAALPSSTCAHLRELEHEHPDAHVCRSRFTEAACTACLDGK